MYVHTCDYQGQVLVCTAMQYLIDSCNLHMVHVVKQDQQLHNYCWLNGSWILFDGHTPEKKAHANNLSSIHSYIAGCYILINMQGNNSEHYDRDVQVHNLENLIPKNYLKRNVLYSYLVYIYRTGTCSYVHATVKLELWPGQHIDTWLLATYNRSINWLIDISFYPS